MLIYSHDTFGLGHLQRCLKIADGLLAAYPELSILLVTGSPVVHRFQLPRGVDYLKLPAVRKIGPERYEARALRVSHDEILRLRTGLVLEAVRSFAPHVLLVDHSPAGMKGEMLPALRYLREHRPECTALLGLRDIIDDPESVVTLWEAQGIYEVLRTLYDRIMVYGAPVVFDTLRAYRFPEDLRHKTVYCHYVTGRVARPVAVRRRNGRAAPQRVLVTIGGGDGAGETVIGNYLEMLRQFADRVTFESVVLTGPFLDDELLARFKREARSLPVTLRRFVSDTTPLLQRVDLVVSTAGYNSITQILTHARRALIIPRVLHRREQLLRARRLAELGWVRFLHPGEVTPAAMFREVSAALADPAEPVRVAREQHADLLDGVRRVTEVCGEVFKKYVQSKGVAHGR